MSYMWHVTNVNSWKPSMQISKVPWQSNDIIPEAPNAWCQRCPRKKKVAFNWADFSQQSMTRKVHKLLQSI